VPAALTGLIGVCYLGHPVMERRSVLVHVDGATVQELVAVVLRRAVALTLGRVALRPSETTFLVAAFGHVRQRRRRNAP
jgi:hypothetical protein